MKTTDKVLILIAVYLILFTIVQQVIFIIIGSEMPVLETCVFGACTGEFGALAWIKTSKIRQEDRKWILEDREHID